MTDRSTPSGARLLADIGGTNARFALTDPDSAQPEILHSQSLPAAGFASLQHAAEHYLQGVVVILNVIL